MDHASIPTNQVFCSLHSQLGSSSSIPRKLGKNSVLNSNSDLTLPDHGLLNDHAINFASMGLSSKGLDLAPNQATTRRSMGNYGAKPREVTNEREGNLAKDSQLVVNSFKAVRKRN
jgi:hypothetical protein